MKCSLIWTFCLMTFLQRPFPSTHWTWNLKNAAIQKKSFCATKGNHLIHSSSSEQNKDHPLRKCTDVFRWQPYRFRCLLSVCHAEGQSPPPSSPLTSSHFLKGFLWQLRGKSRWSHDWGLPLWGGKAGSAVEARPLNGLTRHGADGKAETTVNEHN